MTPKAASIATVAEAFFEACETGKGWAVCSAYCKPNATFSAQAEPLLDVKTLAQYTEWMKGILTVLPDGHYEMRSFATDIDRSNVAAYGIFYGTHTGEGGPVAPTGRQIATDYVYVMQFEGDRIAHMTKIWNAGLALKDLGWASSSDIRVVSRFITQPSPKRIPVARSSWPPRDSDGVTPYSDLA
jgi:predicted ester cyclase